MFGVNINYCLYCLCAYSNVWSTLYKPLSYTNIKRIFNVFSKSIPSGKNNNIGINKSKCLWNGLTYFPNHCRTVPFDAPSTSLARLAGSFDGVVGSFQRASNSLVGRLDGPFNLSHIHLHKQSFSHLHSSMPIPPSHVHSQNTHPSAPFRLVLTRTLVGNHSQGCKWHKM